MLNSSIPGHETTGLDSCTLASLSTAWAVSVLTNPRPQKGFVFVVSRTYYGVNKPRLLEGYPESALGKLGLWKAGIEGAKMSLISCWQLGKQRKQGSPDHRDS